MEAELSNKLKDFLSKIGNDKYGNYTEFEIRFGKFMYDKHTKSSNFESSVEIDFFYRLKTFLDINLKKEKKEFFTKETSHKNNVGRGTIRRILTTDKNFENPSREDILLKNSYNKFNIYDYDIRFSLASERKLIKDNVNGVNWKLCDFVRFKHRMTYTTNIGKVDLTIVREGATEQEALNSLFKYEVEFEISKNSLSDVLELLAVLIKIKQNNFFTISNPEKKEVFKKYSALTNVSYFVGAQPETLQQDQLSLLYKELYSVTDKADGERFFMFIDDVGKVVFIDNNINGMLKTDIQTNVFKNSIIDGELIRNFDEDGELTSIDFYAFDLLFYNSFDIREDTRYLFKQRFDKLKTIINSCSASELVTVQVKKFIYRNVFMGSEIIMKDIQNKKYENDGLIFTPMNEPYPKNKKWSKLLKWKPADQNTIDFYAVKSSDESWQLYVQGQSEVKSYQGQGYQTPTKLLFDVTKLCPDIPNENEITFKTTFDNSLLDPTTREPYQTNTVIEFKWKDGKFVPLRTRWDKTSNPKKHGNFSHVACNIWNNIHNPVSQNTLFHQMTNNTSPNVQSGSGSQNPFFFDRMTNFHNKIHKYLINKYTTRGSILGISPGKSDLSYYEDFKGTLYSFEFHESINSKNNIRESCKNIKNYNVKSYDFTEIEFGKILETHVKQNSYDNVFSTNITAFFESENRVNKLIEFLNHKLSKTGNFIVSFIDSKLLDNISDSCTYTDNEIMYNLIHNDDKKMLFLNSLTYENEPLPIYNRLNKPSFVSMMKDNGYDCIETENFVNLYKEDMFHLEDYEKNISDAMTYCVFSRSTEISGKTNLQTSNPTIIKTKIFDTEEKVPIVMDTVLSHHHILSSENISLYQIKTLGDVVDILNCTRFRFCNPEKTFSGIKDFLSKININVEDLEELSLSLSDRSDRSDISDALVLYHIKIQVQEPKTCVEAEQQEDTEVTFIVLYKNQIFYDIDELKQDIQQCIQKCAQTEIRGPEETKDQQIEMKIEMKIEIQKALSGKTTIAILKEYLKKLNKKSTGNKQELIERLQEYSK